MKTLCTILLLLLPISAVGLDGDFDKDGDVDFKDFLTFADNYGKKEIVKQDIQKTYFLLSVKTSSGLTLREPDVRGWLFITGRFAFMSVIAPSYNVEIHEVYALEEEPGSALDRFYDAMRWPGERSLDVSLEYKEVEGALDELHMRIWDKGDPPIAGLKFIWLYPPIHSLYIPGQDDAN